MTDTATKEKPYLRYFHSTPPAAAQQPELYSALQTFETCLLVLAFRRYPHALVLGVSAIESLLRTYLNLSDRTDITLARNILPAMGRKSIPLAGIKSKTALDAAVKARNDFIHAGYSPRDDRAGVELFMNAVLPYFTACWRELYAYDLYKALPENYAKHLKTARVAFHQADKLNLPDRNFAVSALTAHLRWREMNATAPGEAVSGLQAGSDEGWDRARAALDRLEKTMDNPWVLDCPVCDAGAFLAVALDGEALNQGRVTGRRAACANCGYAIPEPWAFMIKLLCGRQLDDAKDEILQKLVG